MYLEFCSIMLEKRNFLHIAQVQVFGVYGIGSSAGRRVHSVACGNEVTIAVVKPLSSPDEIEQVYKRAIRADAANAEILRHYPYYFKNFDKWSDGSNILSCPNCRGGKFCELWYVFPAFLTSFTVKDTHMHTLT